MSRLDRAFGKAYDTIAHAWNAFKTRDPTNYQQYGEGRSSSPHRALLRVTNEQSVIMAVYNRIANDVAAISIQHVRVDENNNFGPDWRLQSYLNLD